jgi:hypothetical protein
MEPANRAVLEVAEIRSNGQARVIREKRQLYEQKSGML